MDANLAKLDKTLEEYLVGKGPALSPKAKETLVKFAPWLALVFGVIAVPFLLGALGLGIVGTPFAWIAGKGTLLFWIAWALSAAQVVMELMAVKPLMDRKYRGWELMFYSALLSVVASLSNLSVFGLVMTVVTFWLLYQVKASYK